GRDRRSTIVHPSGPAHELRAWAWERRLPQETLRGDERASLLVRHGIYGGQEETQRVGSAGDGGPRRRRTGGRHADYHRRRRRLWTAHPSPRSLPRGHEGVYGPLLASRHPYQPRAGRALAHRHEERARRRDVLDRGEIRFSRGWRRRVAAPGKVRNPGGQGL